MWVEGQVLFPAGTPLDEEAFVEVLGKEFVDGSWGRARVAGDGRFRVAFSERSKYGWLSLSARYAYLETNYRWMASDATPIVLTPLLGGRIEGRLVQPEGVRAESVSGRVSCFSLRADGRGFVGSNLAPVDLRGELQFAFGGLPPGEARLHYDGEAFWAEDVAASMEAGAMRTVELDLLRGVTLAGRVVGENGAPLVGAELWAMAEGEGAHVARTTVSARDGTFRLRGLPHPTIRVGVRLDGFVPVEQELSGMVDSESRTGLDLLLARGNTIAGWVRWPDGAPAHALVRVLPTSERDVHVLADAEVETSAGRFVLSGLGAGPFRVRAVATPSPDGLDAKLGLVRAGTGAGRWKATVDAQAGTDEIELVLTEGCTLSGRVVDERGAPVEFPSVRAERRGVEWWESEEIRATLGRDGSFALDGLTPGEWDLHVRQEGYGPRPPIRLVLPATEPITVLLTLGVRVSGVVLDAHGVPVPAARVYALQELDGPGALDWGGVTADARGAFEFTGLAPGNVRLTAEAKGLAPSVRRELELAVSEHRRDIVLQVRAGGRITGEVLDGDGKPLERVWVRVAGPEESNASARSDSGGRFELVGVLPGEVRVTAMTDGRLELAAQATVVAGEATYVRLQRPEFLVRMSGRVWVAGDPIAGVGVRSRLRESQQDGPSCLSAEGGSYALELPGPGAHWIGLSYNDLGTHLWLAVDVPRCAEFVHDLELPAGRVSGRVRSESGAPLAGIQVEARQTSDETGASGWGNATTDERGEYELLLPPAIYEIFAGGDGGDDDPSRSFARAGSPDIAVVNLSHLRGVDFELAEGGTLEGVVRWGDGTPAANAELWIGPQGKVAESSLLGQADERGRFHIDGIPAGKFVVTATHGQGKAEWEKLEVQPGSVHALELQLAASEWLVVRVLDRDGSAIAAEVEAFDAQEKRIGSLPEEGPSARLGPLPAGRYQVHARLGERMAVAEVTLSGEQETRRLEIVLP